MFQQRVYFSVDVGDRIGLDEDFSWEDKTVRKYTQQVMRMPQGSHPQSWPVEPVDNEALYYLDLEIP